MDSIKKQNLADVIGCAIAGAMLLDSLTNLIPAGNWLYLIYLVFGTVIITNKINRIVRGN